MFEKSNDRHEFQVEKTIVGESVLNGDRLAFFNEFPFTPAYAERLPDGLIEDEI
jgi:hypothetical protein